MLFSFNVSHFQWIEGASVLDLILKFTIQSRSEFIDDALNNFLSLPACHDAQTSSIDLSCNVVHTFPKLHTTAIFVTV